MSQLHKRNASFMFTAKKTTHTGEQQQPTIKKLYVHQVVWLLDGEFSKLISKWPAQWQHRTIKSMTWYILAADKHVMLRIFTTLLRT